MAKRTYEEKLDQMLPTMLADLQRDMDNATAEENIAAGFPSDHLSLSKIILGSAWVKLMFCKTEIEELRAENAALKA
jgi:hypothetical protein